MAIRRLLLILFLFSPLFFRSVMAVTLLPLQVEYKSLDVSFKLDVDQNGLNYEDHQVRRNIKASKCIQAHINDLVQRYRAARFLPIQGNVEPNSNYVLIENKKAFQLFPDSDFVDVLESMPNEVNTLFFTDKRLCQK